MQSFFMQKDTIICSLPIWQNRKKALIFIQNHCMLPLALALAPGIAIILFIYWRDQYEREPLRHLVICFLLGMLSTVPAIIIQQTATPQVTQFFAEKSVWFYAVFAYAVVGFSEELSKFLMLRWYAYPKKAFNEPMDGIVYSVMVSMGFATLENVGYVMRDGGNLQVALIRMILSVPAHASFAIIMGYYVGLAKFNPARSTLLMVKGVLLAAFLHGSYDFFLFVQQSRDVTRYVSTGLLTLGAIASWFIGIRLSLKSIKQHRLHSRNNHHTTTDTLV
jgi:protease PrsW